MGKRGPKPWAPSPEEVEKIKLYAGLGSTQVQVARLIGVCEDLIARHPQAKAAFEEGKAQTIAKVAGSLVRKALNGDTTSAIFYLKTQAGWKETQVQEHTGKDGGPIEQAVTVDPSLISDAALTEFMAARRAIQQG